MFFRKKVQEEKPENKFDRDKQTPVLRTSICNGDKVVGFRDRETGKFEEVACIKSDRDLEDFLYEYGISRAELKKEW